MEELDDKNNLNNNSNKCSNSKSNCNDCFSCRYENAYSKMKKEMNTT